LVTSLNELHSDVAVCTETWINSNHCTEELLSDLESNSKYSVLRRDRQSRGGGVAVIYNRDLISMTEAKLPTTKYEVLAAIGRRTSQRRKVLVIAAYIPPSYDAEETNGFMEYLTQALLLLRGRYVNPYIILGGGFQQKATQQSHKIL
jgi:hypothetical protein